MTKKYNCKCENCKTEITIYDIENICKICGIHYCDLCIKYDYIENINIFLKDYIEIYEENIKDNREDMVLLKAENGKYKDEIDKELLKEKASQWMRIIDGVIDNIKDEDPDEIKALVKKYKEKLKNFRNCGLEKGGEMSLENLVFKLLRRNGYIEKLYDVPTEIIDKKLSMKQ